MVDSQAVNQSARRFQTLELDDILSSLLEIPNPENLKDNNFCDRKNFMKMEFNYYEIR